MSRIWVSNDNGDLMAEVEIDDDGRVSAACEMGDWATDPDRRDSLDYVIDQAGIHMDRAH